MLCVNGYSHPNLGKGRSVVIQDIIDLEYHGMKDGLSPSGTPYVSAYTASGDLVKWFFQGGVVDQCVVVMDGDDLNGYISYLNANYVHDSSFQWSDYSTGERTYYHLKSSGEFFDLIVTLYDLAD